MSLAVNSVDVSLALALAVPAGFGNHSCQEAGECPGELPRRGAAATLTHSLTRHIHHPVASHSYGNAFSVLAMVHLP